MSMLEAQLDVGTPTSTGKLSINLKVIADRVANDEVKGAVTLSQIQIVCHLVVLYVDPSLANTYGYLLTHRFLTHGSG